MKHTKGPWKVTGESTLNIIGFETPKGRRVCSLLATNHEDSANAHLIAASPELLSALELLFKNISTEEMQRLETLLPANFINIQTLISKAKGDI